MNVRFAAGVCVAAGLATGCAPQMGNVIPSEGGNYQVVTTGESRDEALRSALYSAETTCKERHMRHVVLSRSTEYNGVVSEETNQVLEKAQEIVLVTSGELLPTLSGEDDYRMNMRFKCVA